MKSVLVTAPDDMRWSVRVVWEPRWRALARRFGGWRAKRTRRGGDSVEAVGDLARIGDAATGPGGGGGDGVDFGDVVIVVAIVLIGFIAAAALFWWVLLPLLLVLLDFFVVLVLLVVSIAGRVLLGRPWTVRATAHNGEKFTEQVVGWNAALRRRDEIADLLRQGRRPTDGLVNPM